VISLDLSSLIFQFKQPSHYSYSKLFKKSQSKYINSNHTLLSDPNLDEQVSSSSVDNVIAFTYIYQNYHNAVLHREDYVIRRCLHSINLHHNEHAQESFPQRPGSCRREGCQGRAKETREGCTRSAQPKGSKAQHRSHLPLSYESLIYHALVSSSTVLTPDFFRRIGCHLTTLDISDLRYQPMIPIISSKLWHESWTGTRDS
jgi:hypothetical protein